MYMYLLVLFFKPVLGGDLYERLRERREKTRERMRKSLDAITLRTNRVSCVCVCYDSSYFLLKQLLPVTNSSIK